MAMLTKPQNKAATGPYNEVATTKTNKFFRLGFIFEVARQVCAGVRGQVIKCSNLQKKPSHNKPLKIDARYMIGSCGRPTTVEIDFYGGLVLVEPF
jgi:hypothetical protein